MQSSLISNRSHPDPTQLRLMGSGWLRVDSRPHCTFQQDVTNSTFFVILRGIHIYLEVSIPTPSELGHCLNHSGRAPPANENPLDVLNLHWLVSFNPLMLESSSRNCHSYLKLLLTVFSDLITILQNIWREVVGSFPINISPSNIFRTMLLPKRCHQICKALLATPSINRLSLMFTILIIVVQTSLVGQLPRLHTV